MEKMAVQVGIATGDFIGRTDRVIQAAIDYVSYLGGGTVRIGEGEYEIASTLRLRSHVTLEGVPGKTILRQCGERISSLLADADLHERQVTVERPELFPVGQSVTIRKADSSLGFGDTAAVVTGKDGHVLYLDRELHATILVASGGIVTTQTSVISGCDCEHVELRNLIIEGNETNSIRLDGCRNGGIFLFGARHVKLEGNTVTNYNGDGISYQHCSDIQVLDCSIMRNGGKGIHPGSGTTNTVIRSCSFIENGMDGIFLCWRVQDSVIEHNTSLGNGMSGLSIGHKDTHNVIRGNTLSNNRSYGIFFRNEPDPMAANYNRVEDNVLQDNGSDQTGYVGIRIRGYTHDVELIGNRIVFENAPTDRTIGLCLEAHTNKIRLKDNAFVRCAREIHDHWLLDEQE